MSWQATTHVTEHSRHKGMALLTLLMIANHANADGTGAWMSVATLARETRMSERQVQRTLRALERSGEIARTGVHPTNGTHVYSVIGVAGQQIELLPRGDTRVRGDKMSPVTSWRSGVTSRHQGGDIAVSPKPPVEPPVEQSNEGGAPRVAARTDEVQDGQGGPTVLTPQQEQRLVIALAVERWRELRRKHFGARGHFDDPQAIKNLRRAVRRALGAGCTASDISAGLTDHGDDPKGNPWYADEWANRQRAIREEQQAQDFKRADRAESERLRHQADEAQWQALEAQYPGMSRGEIAKVLLKTRRGFQHIGASVERVVAEIRDASGSA